MIGGSIRRSKRRGGFTLTEILVAATLSMVFAGLIAQTIATGVRVSTDTTSRVSAETRAREAFRTTTSALRGATPLGECVEPSTASFAACRVVGTKAYPIVYAGPDRVYFFAQRSTAADGSTAPDLVRLSFDVDGGTTTATGTPAGRYGTFTVTRWSPAGGDYVRPPWPWVTTPCSVDCENDIAGVTPGQKTRIGVVDGTGQPLATGAGCGTQRQILTYFDSTGTQLLPSVGCRLSAQDLQRIALVMIEANVSYDRRGSAGQTFRLSAAVTIASVNYAQVAA